MTFADGFDRILLVGFMGAGKTSVGRALATRLEWGFRDFDEEIERRLGRTVAQIFDELGEEAFRACEAEVGARFLRERHVVLASGGGWAASAGRVASVPGGTATVWLRVAAQTAVRRASAASGTRPLLKGDNAPLRASELLQYRVPYYGQADYAVDTDRSTVEDVTTEILELLARRHPRTGPE